MEINYIKKITSSGDKVEILIGIELEYDSTNRWELEDPNVLVIYSHHDSLEIDRIDLLDRGMKVHGYEFTESEERKISNYLLDYIKKNQDMKPTHS